MSLPELGLGTHRLLRYAFGGFFAALLASTVDPEGVKACVAAMGSVLAPIAALLVGAAVYVLYRYVVGPLLFFSLRRCIQHLLHRVWSWKTPMALVAMAGVPFLLRQAALTHWRATRYGELRKPNDQEHDYLRSAEIGILYIAAGELVVTSLLATADAWRWWIPGVVVLAAATWADIMHHQEVAHWMMRDEQATSALSSFSR